MMITLYMIPMDFPLGKGICNSQKKKGKSAYHSMLVAQNPTELLIERTSYKHRTNRDISLMCICYQA